jgi:hypothetical protein
VELSAAGGGIGVVAVGGETAEGWAAVAAGPEAVVVEGAGAGMASALRRTCVGAEAAAGGGIGVVAVGGATAEGWTAVAAGPEAVVVAGAAL